MNESIKHIRATRILDSRGKPTLRVVVHTEHAEGSFEVPSGASTGEREAHELRDAQGDVTIALEQIEKEIAPALIGISVLDQVRIDETLKTIDGTASFERIGGNSAIGVSMASAHAAALSLGLPFFAYLRTLVQIVPSRKTPHLFVNLVNGGKHANGGSPIQEHQIITLSEDPREALGHAQQCERALHDILAREHIEFSIGDEGGVVFPVSDIATPFAYLQKAIQRAGLEQSVVIGADAAASSFYTPSGYQVFGRVFSAQELSETYTELVLRYGLAFLEDPFHENAPGDFAALAKTLSGVMLIGDDLTTTQAESIERAAQQHAIQGVIIKPNQIGTLSQTLEAMRSAQNNNIACVVSHRSGETADASIADLAYAFGCFGLKAGAPSKKERMIKYERLVAIAHE